MGEPYDEQATLKSPFGKGGLGGFHVNPATHKCPRSRSDINETISQLVVRSDVKGI